MERHPKAPKLVEPRAGCGTCKAGLVNLPLSKTSTPRKLELEC